MPTINPKTGRVVKPSTDRTVTKKKKPSEPSFEIEGEEIVIRLPINNPLVKSKTGRSLVIASTNGFAWNVAEYKGRSVSANINVICKE